MTAAPFTVETLDTWGRVLVATRDIAPWELVLEDTCIANVPNDVPVCLGCDDGPRDAECGDGRAEGAPRCSRTLRLA